MDWHRCKELVQYIGVNAINCLWRSSTCLVHVVVSLCVKQKGEPIVFPHLSRRNKRNHNNFYVKFENDLANLLLPPFRYSSWKWKSPPKCSYPDLCNFPERLFVTQRFHFFLVSLLWLMGKEPQLFPQSLKCHVCLSLNELLWPTFVGGRRDLKMYAGLSWCFGPRLWDFGQLFFSVGGSFTWKCIQGFFGCLGWASKAWDYNDDNE